MQFLKGLFWFLLAVIIAVFSIGNWTTVPIRLWGGLIADVNLPLLLVLIFLAGFLPILLWHVAFNWRLRQKLNAAERTIAELRVPVPPPAETGESVLPLAYAPTSMPPGGA